MLVDMDIINNINKRYNFKLKQIGSDTCYVDSGRDEWLIQVTPCRKGIALWHKNMKFDRDKYHPQHSFYDYANAIHSIYTHNSKHNYKFNNVFRVKELLKQINL